VRDRRIQTRAGPDLRTSGTDRVAGDGRQRPDGAARAGCRRVPRRGRRARISGGGISATSATEDRPDLQTAGGNGRKAMASVRPGATDENMASAPATEQQITSLRKLCQHLGRPEPENMDRLTYANAKELIVQLSHEYNEQRQSRSKAS